MAATAASGRFYQERIQSFEALLAFKIAMSDPTDEALAAAKETGERSEPRRSEEYRDCCIVTRETPYKVETGDLKGTHSSNRMLHIGRVVWVNERLPQVPGKS